MSAPLVTAFGTHYTEEAIAAGCRHALNHLARPIHHTVPGTLWERVEESGKNLVTINGWLAEYTGEHTCGTGSDGYYGAHEPGCGLEPIYHFGGTE